MVQEADRFSRAGTGARTNSPALTLSPYPRRPLIRIILALAVLLGSLIVPANARAITSCLDGVKTPTDVTSVHVQPDSGYQPVLDEINHARCSIDLSMYLFTDQEILTALEHAVNRGIDVRVILEKSPFGTFGDQQEMFDRLIDIEADVRWSPESFTYGHAKYMIVDSSALLVTNQNFTGAGFNRNREFGVMTTEPKYVIEAGAIFEADWSGSTLDTDFEHLVVSPVNARSTVLELIDSSQQSVWMYSEVLRDEDVTAALTAASDRGVDVRILVNPSADEDDVPYFLDALGHGVQIRVLKNPYVHSKVMIIDGERALVGSHNYSYTSLELNREVGMVIDDPADLDLIASVYVRDWSRAEPVDSISVVTPDRHFALTQSGPVGRITFGRWRVV